MANTNPPKKNQAFHFTIGLRDMANPGSFKSSPTLASGDFSVDTDGAGFGALSTTPTVTPASSTAVLVSLSTTEMNGDRITFRAIDQTSPKEWADVQVCILTTA